MTAGRSEGSVYRASSNKSEGDEKGSGLHQEWIQLREKATWNNIGRALEATSIREPVL